MPEETQPKRGSLILIEGLDRSGKSTQCVKLAEALDNACVLRFPDRGTGIGGLLNQYLSQKGDSSLTNDILSGDGNSNNNDKSSMQLASTIEDFELQKRSILKTNHFLFSANRWELVPKVVGLLKEGKTVVLDRYVYSGIAYSYAANKVIDREINDLRKRAGIKPNTTETKENKENKDSNADIPKWLYASDIGLPAPDLVLFLTIDPAKARLRAGFGDERYENVEMQDWVRFAFTDLIADSHRFNDSFSLQVSSGSDLTTENKENSKPLQNVSPWIEIETDDLTIDQVHEKVVKTVENAINAQSNRSQILTFQKII